jgi:hypothetical protein
MNDNHVRVCRDFEGVRYYFLRLSSDGRPEFVAGERIRNSPLMSRDYAVVLAKTLNAHGWNTNVITPENIILYSEATAPPPPQAPKSTERVRMHVGEILIVPGGPPRRGYFIRFPETEFESIWGSDASEAYQKLIENPRASILIPLAEKYIAPPEAIVPPEAAQIPRLRPGSRR